MAICEENCEFKDYNYINKKVKCSCEIKPAISAFKDVKFNIRKLKNNFKDLNNVANIKFLLCYKIVFKWRNLIYNIGFYIMNFIFLLYFIFLILFYSKYYHLYLNKIKNVFFNIKNKYMNTSGNNLNKNQFIGNKKKSKKKKKYFKKVPCKDKNIKAISSSEYSKSKINLILSKKIIDHNITNNDALEYNDSELNGLSYEDALNYDKRTYIKYYMSVLKLKHALIFSFFQNNDYNSRIMKILLFFFSFSIELSINALFFNDDTMHKIYEDQGEFDFLYQLPQIIYSFLLSHFFGNVFNFFSLTEPNILDLKEEIRKKQNEVREKEEKLIKIIKIKFSLFFIFTPIILFVFWFYVTCFCGIYQNTQIHLIKDTLLSFLTSFIFPFFNSLLPGILRRIALKSKKRNKKYLYKLSQFIEDILI